MNITTILLILSSLSCLILGPLAWRRCNSRTLLLSSFVCSIALLIAAGDAAMHRRVDMAFVIPVFTGMMFGGRGGAFLWRSRKEPELWAPALMLVAAAVMSGIGATSVLLHS